MTKEPLIGTIPGPREDRGFWLDLALAVVMVAAWVLFYFEVQHLIDDRRSHTTATAELELNKLEVAMDGYYGRISEDMREFGEWLSQAYNDSTSTTDLIRPFAPYLRRNRGVSSIRLANERGDQVMLTEMDTALLVTEQHGADSSVVQWFRRDGGGKNDTIPTAIATTWTDVRVLPWFGNALQDRRSAARWGVPYPLPGAGAMGITASTALRNDTGTVLLHVLAFDVRLFDPGEVMAPATGSMGPWLFLLGADGSQLLPTKPVNGLSETMATWTALEEPTTVWTTVGGQEMATTMRPYLMNGVELRIGSMVALAPLSAQALRSRYLLIADASLLTLLSALLLAAYRRRRRESKEHRQQQERSRSQRQRLAKAIGEREVLNREVHHRVKNNLQVVTSLLNLQLGKLGEGPVKDEFTRGVRRIDSMAVVHHKLYGLQDLRGIDLNKFFSGLVDNIAATTDTKGTTVSCTVDTDGIKADADTAIELGVILCELVGNCYQHAFPYATGGHIEVSVRHVEGDLHRLVVKDNGQGLNPRSLDGTGKLGLEIVEALASQLDGNFKMSSSAGVTFDVLFRMSKPVQH
ncbi:MAG: sensor histidine kinase [Flavobacteriales bacterium]